MRIPLHKILALLNKHTTTFYVAIVTLAAIMLTRGASSFMFMKHMPILTSVHFSIISIATLFVLSIDDYSRVLACKQSTVRFITLMTIWGIFINPIEHCYMWLYYVARIIGIPTNIGGKLEVETFSSSMTYSLKAIPGALIYAAVFGVVIAILNRSVVWYLRRKERAGAA